MEKYTNFGIFWIFDYIGIYYIYYYKCGKLVGHFKHYTYTQLHRLQIIYIKYFDFDTRYFTNRYVIEKNMITHNNF